MAKQGGTPLVDEQRFILATRDTGYRTTAAAVSELIDNAVQAGATIIRVFVDQTGIGTDREVTVAVLDNGSGMERATLLTAMQFAGAADSTTEAAWDDSEWDYQTVPLVKHGALTFILGAIATESCIHTSTLMKYPTVCFAEYPHRSLPNSPPGPKNMFVSKPGRMVTVRSSRYL
jgi:hypothetical protein